MSLLKNVKRAPLVSTQLLRSTLKRRFGMRHLRPGQQDVITRVLAGRHTLAIMPTGAGKSLCYQLPALLLTGRTVVVSPLIALMKDQCESLCKRGIAAVQLNSALGAAEAHAAESAIADGSARIILTTPERLADAEFMALLQSHPTSLLVVDEAHCISQWGHDFRPAFLDIAPAIALLGKPAVLALTATATDSVAADICSQLGIPKSGVLNTGAYRPNLHYKVEQVTREEDKLARVLALAASSSGSGLVYTATVKAAEAVYEALLGSSESVLRYHGKLPAAERTAAQEAFMNGQTRIMVATNAFGLGIDKPDIRFVLHYQMPAGLDAYYQESGRAGRDGETSECTLLFIRSDKAVQQFFMGGRYPAAVEVDALYRALLQAPPTDSAAPGWTLAALQAQLKYPMNKLKVAVSLLRRHKVATLDAAGRVSLLDTRPGQTGQAGLEMLLDAYRGKREQDRELLEGMVSYAQTGLCRWQALLDHLHQGSAANPCGACDNCLRIAAVEAELAGRAQNTVQSLGSGSLDACTPQVGQDVAGTSVSAFSKDEAVKVRRYGKGIVVAADALSVTVEFANGVRRIFQSTFVERVAAARKRARLAAGAVPIIGITEALAA